MSKETPASENLKHYAVWDRTTRCFHWINVLCIMGLIAVGLVILNNKILGVSGDGKILLKTIHVYIGYVFVTNLMWRIIWGFIGNKYARWQAILPLSKVYWSSLTTYLAAVKSGETPQYLGHNPVARLMVSLLLLLLSLQAVTGLVLAGTDLYLPPFGNKVAEWVAGTDDIETIKNLQPGSKQGLDLEAYEDMRTFRKPFITTHLYSFYLLLVLIVLHITAVVITEVREKNGLVSAMFSGNKVISSKPLDSNHET